MHLLQVAAYMPISNGAAGGASWHEGLPDSASIADCLDRAIESGGLFSLTDYYACAEEVYTLEKQCSAVASVFGLALNGAEIDNSRTVKANLCRTRSEQLALRSFQPDAMEKYDAEGRDTKIRDIKRKCLRFTKWSSLWKPIHSRAAEAMSLQ